MSRSGAWALLVLSAFLGAPLARADMPPPDSCGATAKPGDPCKNAGSGYDQPGRCVARTCRRANPMAPGGVLETGCLLCAPSEDEGAAGAEGAGGAGGAGGGSPAREPGTGTEGRGSSAGPELGGGLVAALLVAIGGVGLLVAGRRP